MSKPDLYLDMDDMSVIMFAGFAAFADIIEPEAIHRVLNTLARLADSPMRTPAAAEGIRQLVRFLEGGPPLGHEGKDPEEAPQQEPSATKAAAGDGAYPRFRAIQGGKPPKGGR